MAQSLRRDRQFDANAITEDGPPREARPLPRCRVVKGGNSTGYHSELASLLQYRLKLVSLLLFTPNLLLLIASLFRSPLFAYEHASVRVFQVTLLFIVGSLSVLLWSKPCLCYHRLRAIELVLFGTAALFFGYTQFLLFQNRTLFDGEEISAKSLQVARMVARGSSARWFMLIVCYGVFIPNSWKRCALIACAAVLTALGLTIVGAWCGDNLNAGAWAGLGDMAIFLSTAVAIAVFGSYRMHLLQAQAYEAKQLGQYRLKRRLGSGGMGEVYEAEHLLLRRPCAIKLIRPEQAGDPTNLQRFEREVQTMARLTHWNTVEVFDYGHADDGTFYYVMEYLPGQNLDVLTARYGPLPPARAVHFLRQVCGALREAHGIGLLHRDIKPSNIIACERGGIFDVAKLLDFGLVQRTGFRADDDKLTTKGTIVGSPPFMSPEQAMGKADLDVRSDIYSLGAVGYYLLTGQPPFARETPMQILMAHAYDPLEPPSRLRPEVPPDLEAVILGCLQKKPENRFPDVQSLERALARTTCAEDWTETDASDWWHDAPVSEAAEDTENHAPVKTMVSARVS